MPTPRQIAETFLPELAATMDPMRETFGATLAAMSVGEYVLRPIPKELEGEPVTAAEIGPPQLPHAELARLSKAAKAGRR